MRIGSICTGLGRLDAAIETLMGGARTAWCAEPDPLCRKVLAGLEATMYEDARQALRAAPVDVLVGGTPCQDLSAAGRRAGADGERSGLLTLIPDLAGLARAVCWENVPGAATAPGPGGRGTALGWLTESLTARGWAVAHTVVPASWVCAPHLRRRLFLLAVRPDAASPGLARRMWPAARIQAAPCAPLGRLLPTPTASMSTGPGSQGRRGGMNLQTAIAAGRHEECGPLLRRWEESTGLRMPAPGRRLTVEFAAWLMGIDPLTITRWNPTRTAAMRAIGNSVVARQAEAAYWLLALALGGDPAPPGWAGAVNITINR